ncbi:MAG: LysR substrate-binding domain-containing protein, partial [Zoogloea sp.]|uniref:LysR substrate-binding domain-containing protein n=1 Tax=Zoogloea sp. TaxID=49181 RepID=UPI003F31C4E9
ADRQLDVGLIEIVTDNPLIDRRAAGSDELQVILAPDHPLAQRVSLKAAELADYPLIHREPGNAIRDLVDQFFSNASIPTEDLNVAAELGSLASVKHLTATGHGFAVASSAAIRQEVAEGSLVGVPLEPRLHTPLEVILLKDKFRSRLVNTFADFVTEEIGQISTLLKN